MSESNPSWLQPGPHSDQLCHRRGVEFSSALGQNHSCEGDRTVSRADQSSERWIAFHPRFARMERTRKLGRLLGPGDEQFHGPQLECESG
jgi:hypothetical protein